MIDLIIVEFFFKITCKLLILFFHNFISNVHSSNLFLILFESINFRKLFITFTHPSINIIFNHNLGFDHRPVLYSKHSSNLVISSKPKIITTFTVPNSDQNQNLFKKENWQDAKPIFHHPVPIPNHKLFLTALASRTKAKPSSKKKREKKN